MIPRAQRTQCWPRWFRRGQLFRRRAVSWRRSGGTIGGQRLGGGQWPPIQVALSCSVAFAVSNVQGRGTTRELRLVALNCKRMVDNGGHALAVYSPEQRSCRSTLHCFTAITLELRCRRFTLLYYYCLPLSYAQHKKGGELNVGFT